MHCAVGHGQIGAGAFGRQCEPFPARHDHTATCHPLDCTCRAKAGGRQSAKDATGKTIKSAGSALRRHNEVCLCQNPCSHLYAAGRKPLSQERVYLCMLACQSACFLSWACTCSGSFVIRAQAALTRDIHETMRAWAPQLRHCALIFVHAPSANAAPLFYGEAPPLDRGDPRVRSVPFTTRRPTFSETKLVAQTLLTVTASEAPAALPPPPSGVSSHFCTWLLHASIQNGPKLNPAFSGGTSRQSLW